MKKTILIGVLASVLLFSMVGCNRNKPAPFQTAQASPTPQTSPKLEPGYDPELYSDTKVFGYLKSVADDSFVVTVKGEDRKYSINDRIKLEIEKLKIEIGMFVAVNFETNPDGTYKGVSLEKNINMPEPE